MKNQDLYGIGNGIVDILLEVGEEAFSKLDFEKGSMMLVSAEEQDELLSRFSTLSRSLISGGSAANSIALFSQLGGKAGYSCRLGDDEFGKSYKSDFEASGITFPNTLVGGASSGTSLIMITPDGERTMRTCLAESALFSASDVLEEEVKRSEWVFIEGYLFASVENGQPAVNQAVKYAKQHSTKIAITVSDIWIVTTFKDAVHNALLEADFVFANEGEAMALTGKESRDEAFKEMIATYGDCAITLGGEGCLVHHGGFSGLVTANAVTPVDTTGAGDAFAGSFLYGLSQKESAEDAAKRANTIAALMVSQVGARFSKDNEKFKSIAA